MSEENKVEFVEFQKAEQVCLWAEVDRARQSERGQG